MPKNCFTAVIWRFRILYAANSKPVRQFVVGLNANSQENKAFGVR